MGSLTLFFNVIIHHFVVLSNHIYLLLTPSENNLGQAMSYMLTNMSKFLNFKNNTINHIFGNRYKPTIIKNEKHLINVIKYIYQNPVKAGLSETIFDYEYSSLGFYLGKYNVGIKLEPDPYTKDLFDLGLKGRDLWIKNISNIMGIDDSAIIQKSLFRSTFFFSTEQLITIKQNKTKIII